jgi:hypothetical protein
MEKKLRFFREMSARLTTGGGSAGEELRLAKEKSLKPGVDDAVSRVFMAIAGPE